MGKCGRLCRSRVHCVTWAGLVNFFLGMNSILWHGVVLCCTVCSRARRRYWWHVSLRSSTHQRIRIIWGSSYRLLAPTYIVSEVVLVIIALDVPCNTMHSRPWNRIPTEYAKCPLSETSTIKATVFKVLCSSFQLSISPKRFPKDAVDE